MLSCKIVPKLRFLANWHREPTYPNHDLHRKQATPNLTRTGRRRVSIATRARERGGLNRNEGERKELVLVVSQTRQDIASRAYVSHLDMRIRVAVVRLNYSCWFVFFKWTTSLRNLPDARPLETYSPVVEGVNVSLRGDNVCLCFRKAQARKEVLYEGTVLP